MAGASGAPDQGGQVSGFSTVRRDTGLWLVSFHARVKVVRAWSVVVQLAFVFPGRLATQCAYEVPVPACWAWRAECARRSWRLDAQDTVGGAYGEKVKHSPRKVGDLRSPSVMSARPWLGSYPDVRRLPGFDRGRRRREVQIPQGLRGRSPQSVRSSGARVRDDGWRTGCPAGTRPC